MGPYEHHNQSRGQKRKRPDGVSEAGVSEQNDHRRDTNGLRERKQNHSNTTASPIRGLQPSSRPDHGASNGGRPQGQHAGRRAALEKARSELPITAHKSSIIASLNQTDILLLSGETGSGKSTQLPQFLLTSPWRKNRIAVTQPRRVAAINLARRVADELGTSVGKSSPAAKVGYSVRFDDNVGRSNDIKFLTEGMLLQEMLRDPGLSEYDVVVVDEVHERSVNVDLILGFLKNLAPGVGPGAKKRKGRKLKIVVMSATADIERLTEFFEQGYKQETNLTNDELRTVAAETNVDQNATKTTQTDTVSQKAAKSAINGQESRSVSLCAVQGRQYPVQTIYLPEPAQDFSDAALRCIFQIHCKEPMPGDILVFLTGQETIQSLQKNVEEYAQSLTHEYPRMLVLPLYAALSQAAQQRIFESAPPNTRKVILATNIAETSITVPGVRFVVDSGKEKRKQYRPRLGLDSLLVKAVSQSSAIQRKGRAGREAAGKCWRLYTEKDYNTFEPSTLPEILRCDLASAVLTMKANGVEDVLNFPLLTPPSRESLARSLMQLYTLGALSDNGNISDLGRKIARFPLSPSFGRVLLAATDDDKNCLLPVIDIVSVFSSDNSIFPAVETEQGREEAHTARQRLYRRQGDHLTLLAAVQGYAAENTDRKDWATRHLISHRAMQGVMDIRKQLRSMCRAQGLIKSATAIADYDADPAVDETTGTAILKCFLQGFRQNVARLMPDGSYKTFFGNQNVAIHPSSVLFGRKVEAILYNEFVFTNRTYARGVSAVQADWVGEVIGGDEV
ncbi:hypothetical protein MBLNU457_g3009t1 [Dothideomycetes sp. NU457]